MRWLARVAVVRLSIVVAVLAMPRAIRADETDSEPAQRQRIATLLSDYESLPEPRPLIAGGAHTADILFELYQDTELPTFIRVRALRALSSFPSDVAAARLKSVLRDPGARLVFLREAAIGLARCAGEGAIDSLSILLTRPDAQLRRTAVEALRTLSTTTARARLVAHRAHETDPNIRDLLDAALATDQAR